MSKIGDQIQCIYCPTGIMRLVDICHGITGGDKWSCKSCGSFAVVQANQIPRKEKQ